MSVKVVVQKVCDKHDKNYNEHDIVIFNQPDNKKLMKLYDEVKSKNPHLIYIDKFNGVRLEYICYYDYAKRWEGNLRKYIDYNKLHTYYIMDLDELKHFRHMDYDDKSPLTFDEDDVYFIMYH